MSKLNKLIIRLGNDAVIMVDCVSRFNDGIDELQDPMPSFNYLRRQLEFLEERMEMIRARLADYEREYVAVEKGGGA